MRGFMERLLRVEEIPCGLRRGGGGLDYLACRFSDFAGSYLD